MLLQFFKKQKATFEMPAIVELAVQTQEDSLVLARVPPSLETVQELYSEM